MAQRPGSLGRRWILLITCFGAKYRFFAENAPFPELRLRPLFVEIKQRNDDDGVSCCRVLLKKPVPGQCGATACY